MWAAAPLLLLLLLLLSRLWRRGAAALEPAGRAVLITGCDSGFGHLLALRLHRLGFTVFAGCLCPGGDGARRLQREAAAGAGRLRVLRLDVTRARDVLAAKELVLSHLPERGEATLGTAGVGGTRRGGPLLGYRPPPAGAPGAAGTGERRGAADSELPERDSWAEAACGRGALPLTLLIAITAISNNSNVLY